MNPINENPRSGRGRGTAVCSDSRNSTTSAAAVLAKLRRENKVLREFRPLQLGIDLPARDASDKQSRRALALHCVSQRYLEAVAPGGPRYALDGSVCGEVSRLQREAAKARLETIAEAASRKAARLAKLRGRS
jgi:sRNA-binding protein